MQSKGPTEAGDLPQDGKSSCQVKRAEECLVVKFLREFLFVRKLGMRFVKVRAVPVHHYRS